MHDIRKLFFITVFFAFTISSFFSQAHKSDNSDIILFEFREGFFDIPFYLDTLKASGYFSYEENSPNTRCLYFTYGPYQCYFYAEPGVRYKVILPDLSAIDTDWKYNPYFQPASFHCKVQREQPDTEVLELNSAIREFEARYEPFLSTQVLRYYNSEFGNIKLDSFISVAFKSIKVSDPEYFDLYREYRKALLFLHENKNDLKDLIHQYLQGKPHYFNIPSYRMFFSLSLGEYFDYLQRTEGFEDIYSKFRNSDTEEFKSYLKNDVLMRDEIIMDMVILKECYDGWYNEQIQKSKVMQVIDNVKRKTQSDPIKIMANFLIKNFTFLSPGSRAPEIHATDINGDSVKIDSLNNKMIYLGFCDLNSFNCLKEIEYLKYLHSKHSKYIDIISVLKSADPKQLESLLNDEIVKWHIIHWDDWPGIADIYEIKAVPSFLLIDRDGRILQNPARNPSANFEYELFLILRKKGEV